MDFRVTKNPGTERRRAFRKRRSQARVIAYTFVAFTLACAPALPPPETKTFPIRIPPPELEPLAISEPDIHPRSAALRLLDETRFNLNLQDADLSAVLLGLGQDSPLNVVVEPNVVGRVSLNLENASLLQILDRVVLPRGFQYQVGENVLRVYQPERETRVYQIDYPNYSRNGTTDLTVSGAIASKPAIGEGSGGSGAEDTSTAAVQTIQTVDFWTEIEDAVRSIVLGDGGAPVVEGGSPGFQAAPRVLVSRQSGLISVSAPGPILAEVETYLESVAEAASRQVLIDTEIVEVTISDDLQLGVDAEYAPDLGGGAEGAITPMLTASDPAAVIASQLTPTFNNGAFSIGFVKDNMGLLLRALAEQTDVRVLSTPSITTLNNHKALIKVVRNEVFFVAQVETQITEGALLTTTEFVPNVIPIGVTLDVTPQISAAGEITMHVHPSVSEVVDVRSQPTSDATLPTTGSLPVIDLRETDTVLRVRDGQTLVIGGLIQSRDLDKERKVPFLGDIPWLGQAFRYRETEELRTELMIFLTPTIMDSARIVRIEEQVRGSQRDLDSLRNYRRKETRWWRRPLGQSYEVVSK